MRVCRSRRAVKMRAEEAGAPIVGADSGDRETSNETGCDDLGDTIFRFSGYEDSRKFVQKFVRQKIAAGKFARRICSEQIFEQKKIIWAIFRQAIEGSKFDEKFVKFPTHRPDQA